MFDMLPLSLRIHNDIVELQRVAILAECATSNLSSLFNFIRKAFL